MRHVRTPHKLNTLVSDSFGLPERERVPLYLTCRSCPGLAQIKDSVTEAVAFVRAFLTQTGFHCGSMPAVFNVSMYPVAPCALIVSLLSIHKHGPAFLSYFLSFSLTSHTEGTSAFPSLSPDSSFPPRHGVWPCKWFLLAFCLLLSLLAIAFVVLR